ncbi:MAG: putative toxin-antitoxin system toxin component, PIN family [Vitreimonas sp.]
MLDTNVLVAGMRSPKGASAALVRAARSGAFEMAATATLFFEYEAVMLRPEHLEAAGLTADDVMTILDRLAASIAPVRVSFAWRPQVRDPNDDMVLEAAVNGRADAIVSFERDVFRPAAERFGIEALTPGQAWARIRP